MILNSRLPTAVSIFIVVMTLVLTSSAFEVDTIINKVERKFLYRDLCFKTRKSCETLYSCLVRCNLKGYSKGICGRTKYCSTGRYKCMCFGKSID